jgi:hypothetical protein
MIPAQAKFTSVAFHLSGGGTNEQKQGRTDEGDDLCQPVIGRFPDTL